MTKNANLATPSKDFGRKWSTSPGKNSRILQTSIRNHVTTYIFSHCYIPILFTTYMSLVIEDWNWEPFWKKITIWLETAPCIDFSYGISVADCTNKVVWLTFLCSSFLSANTGIMANNQIIIIEPNDLTLNDKMIGFNYSRAL